jgi:hypothetical protein
MIPPTILPIKTTHEEGKSERVAKEAVRKETHANAAILLQEIDANTRFMNPLAKVMYMRTYTHKFVVNMNGNRLQRDLISGTGTIEYSPVGADNYDPAIQRVAKRKRNLPGLLNCDGAENSSGRVFSGRQASEQQLLQSLAADANIIKITKSLERSTASLFVGRAATKEAEGAIVALRDSVTASIEAEDKALTAAAAAATAVQPTTDDSQRIQQRQQVAAAKKTARAAAAEKKRLIKKNARLVEILATANAKVAATTVQIAQLTAKLQRAKQTQVQRVMAAAKLGIPTDVATATPMDNSSFVVSQSGMQFVNSQDTRSPAQAGAAIATAQTASTFDGGDMPSDRQHRHPSMDGYISTLKRGRPAADTFTRKRPAIGTGTGRRIPAPLI